MKLIANKAVLLLSAVFACLVLFTACESKKENNEHSEYESMKEEHVHTYTCPMHPEVKSDKPGKCPKCGMNLEHKDEDGHNHSHADNGKKYEMTFKSNPSTIEAGKPTKLSFRPEEAGKTGSLVPLELVHEKKIHLLIMSKDLSYFAHEHPDYTSEGSYVWEHKFPAGGEYLLFQDYTPEGAGHQLGRQEIKVSGKETSAKKLGEQNLVWEGEGYKATLASAKPFEVGTSIELKATIQKNGKPVTDLENYLGALAHMVIVSEDTKEYLHVHPMESTTKGPDIILHTNFPKKGKYKVFMQFSHEGKIHTSSFIVNAI